jgi:hypothetical protein
MYRLEMSSDPEFNTNVQEITTSNTSHTHDTAYTQQKYFYRVIAFIED